MDNFDVEKAVELILAAVGVFCMLLVGTGTPW